jgi:putative FmdB family regulatory protein
MPLYEYECFLCHRRFERIQRVSQEPVTQCPSCGGAVRRLLGVPALQFKGSGWYVTDYGKGSGTSGDAKPKSAASDEKPATSSGDAAAATSGGNSGGSSGGDRHGDSGGDNKQASSGGKESGAGSE